MSPETVLAICRPRPGREEELREILRTHVPTLRRLGLATARPVVLLRSPKDGTYIEIFEWSSGEAARKAHASAEVAALWERMGALAEFPPLSSLAEATSPFPHFERVLGIVE